MYAAAAAGFVVGLVTYQLLLDWTIFKSKEIIADMDAGKPVKRGWQMLAGATILQTHRALCTACNVECRCTPNTFDAEWPLHRPRVPKIPNQDTGK